MMAFQDTYRLSIHAVITNDEQQVLQIKATYTDNGHKGTFSLKPRLR